LSVIGAALYVVLLTWVAKPFLNADEYYDRAYDMWNDSPLLYKLGAVFVPVVNIVFALMVFLLMYIQIRWWWYDLGHFVVCRFTRGKILKHFVIKEFIVRTFFRFYIDLFYDRFENDLFDKVIKKVLKDEKSKQQPECDSELHATSGDKEASAEGEENNPA
jgi:hypothetical protein